MLGELEIFYLHGYPQKTLVLAVETYNLIMIQEIHFRVVHMIVWKILVEGMSVQPLVLSHTQMLVLVANEFQTVGRPSKHRAEELVWPT